MRCIYCGFQNAENATTCNSCHRSLSTVVLSGPGSLAALLAANNTSEAAPPSSKAASATATPPPLSQELENLIESTLGNNSVKNSPESDKINKLDMELPNWLSSKPAPPPMPMGGIDFKTPPPPPPPTVPMRGKVSLDTLLPDAPEAPTVAEPAKKKKRWQIGARTRKPAIPKLTGKGRFSRLGDQALTPTSLNSNDFVCPRCRKVRPVNGAMFVADSSGASRRVCYKCAYEVRAAASTIDRATNKDWLPGLLGGIVAGGLCAALFFIISSLTPLLLLKAWVLVGILVGAGTRIGANNRHGWPLSVMAVVLTLITLVVCAYANLAGLARGRKLGLEEFQAAFGQLPLTLLEWASAVLGLAIAFIIPFGPIQWRKR